MSEHDRTRWDAKYAERRAATVAAIGPPEVFAPFEEVFPTTGHALDVACGQGLSAAWLACRGMTVWGLDISAVAISQARDLAHCRGVGDRCRFDVVDLDDGLPAGPPADVIVCHRFSDRRLDEALVRRLAPGGLLAIAVLSEVGAGPGAFRAAPGELCDAFPELDPIETGEGGGQAWLLGRAAPRG